MNFVEKKKKKKKRILLMFRGVAMVKTKNCLGKKLVQNCSANLFKKLQIRFKQNVLLKKKKNAKYLIKVHKNRILGKTTKGKTGKSIMMGTTKWSKGQRKVRNKSQT